MLHVPCGQGSKQGRRAIGTRTAAAPSRLVVRARGGPGQSEPFSWAQMRRATSFSNGAARRPPRARISPVRACAGRAACQPASATAAPRTRHGHGAPSIARRPPAWGARPAPHLLTGRIGLAPAARQRVIHRTEKGRARGVPGTRPRPAAGACARCRRRRVVGCRGEIGGLQGTGGARAEGWAQARLGRPSFDGGGGRSDGPPGRFGSPRISESGSGRLLFPRGARAQEVCAHGRRHAAPGGSIRFQGGLDGGRRAHRLGRSRRCWRAWFSSRAPAERRRLAFGGNAGSDPARPRPPAVIQGGAAGAWRSTWGPLAAGKAAARGAAAAEWRKVGMGGLGASCDGLAPRRAPGTPGSVAGQACIRVCNWLRMRIHRCPVFAVRTGGLRISSESRAGARRAAACVRGAAAAAAPHRRPGRGSRGAVLSWG